MNPRVEYEMTQEDLEELLDACKPTPCILIGNYSPSSPQENANRAWYKLGKKMGFDSMSARPSSKGQRFFTAVPTETDAQKAARLEREEKEKRQSTIEKLEVEIAERQKQLSDIMATD